MKKNNGVSAVMGVILMVAITVAIASTVYIYVSQKMLDNEYSIISGNITDVTITTYTGRTDVTLVFDNTTTICFYNSDNMFILGDWYSIEYYTNNFGNNIIYSISYKGG